MHRELYSTFCNTYKGKDSGKEYTSIYSIYYRGTYETESLCYTPETNTT